VPDFGCTLGDELIRPTKIYVKPLLHLVKQFGKGIGGICHITGGGLFENVPRMLPEGIRARIEAGRFPKYPIFEMIARKGSIPVRDMYNTFNMGVGIVLAVKENIADAVMSELRIYGETPVHIGHCVNDERGVDLLW